jgi:hypothetical protein
MLLLYRPANDINDIMHQRDVPSTSAGNPEKAGRLGESPLPYRDRVQHVFQGIVGARRQRIHWHRLCSTSAA